MKVKEMEDKISDFWGDNDIYNKAKLNRKDAKKWYWLDGPPYATGSIHVGTAMNKVLKDFYLRFYRMFGFNAWSQPGYDTHGVPIENKVEKMMGFKSKQDIEKFGVENFVKKCEEFATKFVDVMGEQFIDLGVWMDWDNPYMTLNNDYIEGAWFTFKKAYESGLLYRGEYSVHVCPRCETAVAYNEIEYKEIDEKSIYVKFKINDKKNEYLVIWTTTPWTIPSNTGVMVNPNEEYVRVDVGKDILIVGKPLLENLMDIFGFEKYNVVETLNGKDLAGIEYNHPLSDIFEFQKNLKNAHRVVLSDQYVTMTEGTGLVHTAPGHGQEDYKVGVDEGLPVVNPLNMDGTFGNGSGKYEGIFAKKADSMIVDELRSRKILLGEKDVRHDYPMCWRCGSPLLMMAVPQWFFKVTEIRKKLLEANKKINWVPEWAGQRFKDWLENLGDWPISRQRYWGIPLPIWVCDECDKIKVVGSRDELPKVPKDFHKPYIDMIFFDCECGGKMERVPDVLDVWFDSGVAAWASMGYPENKDLFEEWWPVDFVLEGPDQIRGWWNSSMITSIMTFNRRPFNNILFHGFVLDAHGNKMSKSKGNIVTTEEAIDKYGRDVLRFYYLSRPVWNDMYFKPDDMDELAKSFMVVRNTFNFVKTYVSDVPKEVPDKLNKEDKWLFSRLNSVIDVATENSKNFVSHKAANEILDFILNDFSRWYIKIVRDRVWPEYDGDDKLSAYYTFYKTVDILTKLLAPFCPYLSENVYQDIIKPLSNGDRKESIHMEDWPTMNEKYLDDELEEDMSVVKDIVEACHKARHDAGIKLRWPVGSVVVISDEDKIPRAVKKLDGVLKKMCNSKQITVMDNEPKGEYSKAETDIGDVLVNTEMTKDLMDESLIRELVRKIQRKRKKRGLKVSDKISLYLMSDENTNSLLNDKKDELEREVGADEINISEFSSEDEGELNFKSVNVKFDFQVTGD